MGRNSDYEKIRLEVRKEYKEKLENLTKENQALKREIQISTGTLQDLMYKIKDLESENKELRRMTGKSDEEINTIQYLHKTLDSSILNSGILALSRGRSVGLSYIKDSPEKKII